MHNSATDRGSGAPENVVYIGKKPAMNYVLAVVTQFNSGAKAVIIKARGNTIGRAVDVAEIARSRFIPDIKNPSGEMITISSEELDNEDGTRSKVSTIQLHLAAGDATPGENIVYIGKKPAMNYVLAVVTQFNSGAKAVTIKARGNTIGRAVDVAEITRNRFVQNLRDLNTGGIRIASEEIDNEDGTKSKVSSIQIVLSK